MVPLARPVASRPLAVSAAHSKDVYRPDFKAKENEKREKLRARAALASPDPWTPLKLGLKALAVGVGLGTLASILMGAWDPAYRRRLRTIYPYAALWLDVFMVPEVLEDEGGEIASEAASPFREHLRQGITDAKVK
jgi:hypothetical protein